MGVGDKPKPQRHKMKAKRKRHEPEFKARVALEALKGVKTPNTPPSWTYEIEKTRPSQWRGPPFPD